MENKSEELQKFLDDGCYSRKGILLYEKVFGKYFFSTGGLSTTKKLCSGLGLKPGQKVLDVGCGLGGSAFHMAESYGVSVYGVDLSTNMNRLALENRKGFGSENVAHSVQFHIGDALTMEYPSNYYDLVYSRDAIMLNEDKITAMKQFHKCLKPGGVIMITDYCMGDLMEYSKEFTEFCEKRKYFMLTVKEYGRFLEKAGFIDVEAVDNFDEFYQALSLQLQKFCSMKDEILEDHSEEEFEQIRRGWEHQLKIAKAGDHVWGYFKGKKSFA